MTDALTTSEPRQAELQHLYGRRVFEGDGAVVEVLCPICGSGLALARYRVEGVASPVVVCVGCGLGRFHPMPSLDTVAGFYPPEYYGAPGRKFVPGVEALVRWVGARHLGFLSRELPVGARVLDVGCGRGVVLGALADRGFEVHGVEGSKAAAQGADPRAEIRIAPRLADAGYASGFFDQVIVWHVLEHLPDPVEALREVRRILRPGGRLIVAVPNFGSSQARWAGSAWFHLDLPRHLHHFPLPALQRLLAGCGFEPFSAHHFSLRQNPFGWIQSAENRLGGLPRNALYTLLQRRPEAVVGSPLLRMRLLLGFALGALPALGVSVWDAWRQRGATVHLEALRRPD